MVSHPGAVLHRHSLSSRLTPTFESSWVTIGPPRPIASWERPAPIFYPLPIRKRQPSCDFTERVTVLGLASSRKLGRSPWESLDRLLLRSKRMKVSDLMVKCLEAEGVRYIFGVPGEETEDLLFSLEGSSITFVPCRHEQGAAFIALPLDPRPWCHQSYDRRRRRQPRQGTARRQSPRKAGSTVSITRAIRGSTSSACLPLSLNGTARCTIRACCQKLYATPSSLQRWRSPARRRSRPYLGLRHRRIRARPLESSGR
jgi:hypothetical protein